MKSINEKTLLTEHYIDPHAEVFRRMTNRYRTVYQTEDGRHAVKLHGHWWLVQKWVGLGWGRAYLVNPLVTPLQERNFEEDVVCDHCSMEIDGPGIASGYTDGEIGPDGATMSGWMHKSDKICLHFIKEENLIHRSQGDEFVPTKPPNRSS